MPDTAVQDLAGRVVRAREEVVRRVEAGVPADQVCMGLADDLDDVLRAAVHAAAGAEAGRSWLVLGSLGRREIMPGSDVDTALVVLTDDVDAARQAAARVHDLLDAAGVPRCEHGVSADAAAWSGTAGQWRERAHGWFADAGREGVLLAATALADARPLAGDDDGDAVRDVVREVLGLPRPPQFLHALGAYTVAARAPQVVLHRYVEHGGEHAGQVDLKRGLRPLANLGRWVALVTGEAAGTTPQRLERGHDAGLLGSHEALDLVAGWHDLLRIALRAEVEQQRRGRAGSTWVRPGDLSGPDRRAVREAFTAVTRVQHRLEATWALRPG